ncbi:hypothetical protein T4E_12232 [Trichinella pseudospiralis]|uniref:Uncharacterized protein n=1 Tax=Trichinella pseudospiralis TaxID=6337 RepID=A0A0V0Y8R7_TRIPS|nr:hypothetical protein T4E_12232 [Trichinella pseudospiralis]
MRDRDGNDLKTFGKKKTAHLAAMPVGHACIAQYHNLVHLQCETNANKDNCSRNESAPKVCTK